LDFSLCKFFSTKISQISITSPMKKHNINQYNSKAITKTTQITKSQCPCISLPGISSFLASNLIKSSILRIVIAASVANFKDLTLLTVGSRTPNCKLFLIFPPSKSNPQCFNYLYFSSEFGSYDLAWADLSFEIKSEASYAALEARTFGITDNASANSEIASYSLEPKVLA